MRSYLFAIIFYSLSICVAFGQPKRIELPFSVVDGYGPFIPNSLGVSWQDTIRKTAWSATQKTLGGIPANWKQVKQGSIWLDTYQFVYQNWNRGKITLDFYNELQTSWGWLPDTSNLSAKPIKCTVQVATGVDAQGKSWLLLDTNNNDDFGDEIPFVAPERSLMSVINGEINVPPLHQVQLERYEKGRILLFKTNVTFSQSGGRTQYHFPQFGVASLQSLGSPKLLVLLGDGFSSPTLAMANAAVLDDTSNTRRKIRTNMSKPGEFVTINQITYNYQGVDLQRQMVLLQPGDPSDSLYSTQIGYKAHPITAHEFTTGKPLSLSDYRGKYVLIDFWGTWCAPCVSEMKHLKEAYAQTKRDDFEIIGVVCNDTPERLRAFLDKQTITWPQVMATSANKLTETFQVTGYPTTFLIDPQGKVLLTRLGGGQTLSLIKDLISRKR